MRVGVVLVLAALAGCAKGGAGAPGDGGGGGGGGGPTADASCGDQCDTDHDGVVDPIDQCPNTPMGAMVNMVGCADSQLTPVLDDTFPPYDLAWSMEGDLGRAGGLLWTYTGIVRGDLFHIWWIVCDDPATPCGVSLDGPIDQPGEAWTYDTTQSNLAAGVLVATNTTGVLLADGTTRPLTGRLTVTIVDGSNAPLPVASVGTLGVPARDGMYGAEIPGTAYNVTALVEVEDQTTMTWTPFLDYYDAAPTPMGVSNATVSFGGSFYDK
jgi:hypothetical protein